MMHSTTNPYATMKALFTTLLLLISAVATGADMQITIPELKVFNGVNDTVYTNLRSTKVEPDGVRFVHDGGIVKIPFEHLSEEIRVKCGYDLKEAAAYSKDASEKSQATAEKIAKQRLENAERENKLHKDSNSPPKPTGPVTQGDVKAVWYGRLASYRINPLDRDREEQAAAKESLMDSIRAGKLDHRAAVFAHEYNAWMYRQNGEHEKAEKEQDKIRKMEAIAATKKLAAANSQLAGAVNRLADVIATNPYRSYY